LVISRIIFYAGMDDALFLLLCAVVLFISGGLILVKYGDVDGLAVIAFALVTVGGAVYVARKPQKTSNPKVATVRRLRMTSEKVSN
jgi:hypothetical protein